MKLVGSIENKLTKDKSGENVPHLEITEVELVHCNVVNIDYQQYSWALYRFISNKPFGSLLEMSPKNHIILGRLIENFMPLKCSLQIKIVNH